MIDQIYDKHKFFAPHFIVCHHFWCSLLSDKENQTGYQLYRSFTKNDGMRNLMAKDPLRFHNSIVYLMVCAMHSKYTSLQYDKLKMIVRYICEVCPIVYQKEMLVVLKKFILDDDKKNSGMKPIIDIDAFLNGNPVFVKKFIINYSLELNGVGLAEEIARYLTEKDKIYLMYLLFRVATANGKFTTTGTESSLVVMNNLCVNGLGIDKGKLDLLIQHYTNNNLQRWYDEQFGNTGSLYPLYYDQMGDIFRTEDKSFAFVDQVKEISVITRNFLLFLIFAFVLNLISDAIFITEENGFFVFFVSFFILYFSLMIVASSNTESEQYYILRTCKDDNMQFRSIIVLSVFSINIVTTFLWGVSNLL